MSAVESLPGLGFAGNVLVASELVSGVLLVGVSVRIRVTGVLIGARAVGRSASRTPSTLELVVIMTRVLGCGAHDVGEYGTRVPRKTSLGGVVLVIVMLGIEVYKIVLFIVVVSWMGVLAAEVP